jgi:hypothetical protein
MGDGSDRAANGLVVHAASRPREGTMHLDRSRFAGWRAGAIALGLAVALGASPAWSEEIVSQEAKETASHGGKGVAAGLSSVVYAPVKVAYAAGGSIVAGLAWVLSGGDSEVAKPIIDASVRGDYVVTPEHLTGERTLEFVGRPSSDHTAPAAEVSAGAAAAQGAGDSWQ